MKNRFEHKVSLPKQAIFALKALASSTEPKDGDFIFSAQTKTAIYQKIPFGLRFIGWVSRLPSTDSDH